MYIARDRKAPTVRAQPAPLAPGPSHALDACSMDSAAVNCYILVPALDAHDSLRRAPERRVGPVSDPRDVVDQEHGVARGELAHREDVGLALRSG